MSCAGRIRADAPQFALYLRIIALSGVSLIIASDALLL